MKGKTNNPHGRPKGVPNKKNAELRDRVSNFIENNWPNVQSDFELLEARDRLIFIEKMMSYALPRLQSIELESDPLPGQEKTIIVFTEGMKNVPDYKSMSDDELRALISGG